jgi:hypothetical protein
MSYFHTQDISMSSIMICYIVDWECAYLAISLFNIDISNNSFIEKQFKHKKFAFWSIYDFVRRFNDREVLLLKYKRLSVTNISNRIWLENYCREIINVLFFLHEEEKYSTYVLDRIDVFSSETSHISSISSSNLDSNK